MHGWQNAAPVGMMCNAALSRNRWRPLFELGAQLSDQGASGLILFAALISINLAVLNSLPFPLLDGGQFTLIIIEALRGRPIPEKIQLIFMQSGFVLLVGLSILLIIRDTSQLEIFKQLTNR